MAATLHTAWWALHFKGGSSQVVAKHQSSTLKYDQEHALSLFMVHCCENDVAIELDAV
jgi:hypothetical protein